LVFSEFKFRNIGLLDNKLFLLTSRIWSDITYEYLEKLALSSDSLKAGVSCVGAHYLSKDPLLEASPLLLLWFYIDRLSLYVFNVYMLSTV